MALATTDGEDFFGEGEEFAVLEVRSPDVDCTENGSSTRVPELVGWELRHWEPLRPEASGTVKIRVHRTRLAQHSTYFRSLFGGNFRESTSDYVIVQWNSTTFIAILGFIYGVDLVITFTNFVPLLEGALFFGVETVIMECKNWSVQALTSKKMKLEEGFLRQLITIWNFGADNGIHFILEHCADCLALNFVEIVCLDSFANLPYALLKACISHPQLTVYSERQLCEALLMWSGNNCQCSEFGSSNFGENFFQLFEKVRIGILPLEFILGKLWREYPSIVRTGQTTAILDQISHPRSNNHFYILDGNFESFRLRLTQYSEKLDLSGCQQVTGAILFFSLLPPGSVDAKSSFSTSSEKLKSLFQKPLAEGGSFGVAPHAILHKSPFVDLQELNLSCCWRIIEDDIIEWLQLASPSLRIFKARYCPWLKVSILNKLSQACPLLEEADFSVDISPVIAQRLSVLYNTCETCPGSRLVSNRSLWSQSMLSNLTKLSLEGRLDIRDVDLITITALSCSISFLNINGCISLTDLGISRLLNSCTQLHSLHAACTSFGPHSIRAPLFGSTDGYDSPIWESHPHLSCNSTSRLVELDLGGCHGIDQVSLMKYMSSACLLSFLSLRHTHLEDGGLFSFKGTSLENLDVSETLVSGPALAYIIARNPALRVLNARGCRKMSNGYDRLEIDHSQSSSASFTSISHNGELFQALGSVSSLQELAIGWGLSGLILETLKPALRSLKSLTVGLGGSLGQQAWMMLPEICPSLERISVCFQVVSDEGIVNVLKKLRHMHTLELQHCLGEITSQCLHVHTSNLKSLKLDRVAPWMTDDDLAILTQNCRSLCQLSLVGCKFLTSGAQRIIASGWPGLTRIQLEDCFEVTADGVSSLLDCKVVEDLLLRHNGSGIQRNFILDAALKLPLLRTLSLDLCDACETGFDTPNYLDRFSLSTVKLARCKFQRCAFHFEDFGLRGSGMVQPRRVHKETIVLEWNNTEFRTTKVAERL